MFQLTFMFWLLLVMSGNTSSRRDGTVEPDDDGGVGFAGEDEEMQPQQGEVPG